MNQNVMFGKTWANEGNLFFGKSYVGVGGCVLLYFRKIVKSGTREDKGRVFCRVVWEKNDKMGVD